MDTDAEAVWELFRHIFPEFSFNHILIYKLLWQVEPKTGEAIIEESKLARATVYKILRGLIDAGLVAKTSFKPVCYYAANPAKAYSAKANRIISKLKKGRERLKRIIENSSSLSSEIYLIKKDGGQCTLVNEKTRQTILDEYELREIRKMVDSRITEVQNGRQKLWAVYR